VAECFSLSDLKGYRTDGSLHFIVNNQIRLHTYPRYSLALALSSDEAKMITRRSSTSTATIRKRCVAAKVAIECGRKVHKPVFIDMFCYRPMVTRGDEPRSPAGDVQEDRNASRYGEIYSKRLIADEA